MASQTTTTSQALLAFVASELGFLCVFTAALVRLPRNARTARLASLLPLSALSYSLALAFLRLCPWPQWRCAASSYLFLQIMSASELLCLTRADASSLRGRGWRWWLRPSVMLWDFRRVGPRGGGGSRGAFVRRRLGTTLLAYLILDAAFSAPPPPPDLRLLRLGAETLVHMRRLSAEDLVFRAVGTASYCVCTASIVLIMFNVTAILSVGLGLSRPGDHPPTYGPVREGYTVRRFWRNVWHSHLRSGVQGHADSLVAGSMVANNRLLARYARLSVAFFLSGLIHLAVDLALGLSAHESGALTFFCLQPLGIMIEDAAQALRVPLPGRWGRAVGYLWVAVFMVWAAPVWFYPLARIDTVPGDLLPVRVVGPLVKMLSK